MGKRLKDLITEYGVVAIAIWLVILGLCWSGFAVAISLGFNVEGAVSGAGVVVGAWAACQVIKPLRIAATVVLTPIVAAAIRKLRNRSAPTAD